MSFLSLTWDEGVFALRLDFSLFRRRPQPRESAPPPPPVSRPSAKRHKKKLGPKPLPPPFPLPPVKSVEDDLFDAPALATHPPLPTPSVIVDASLNAVSLTRPELETLEARGPDATLLMDDDDVLGEADTAISPLDSKKTDLVKQRREVRRALRGTAR